MAIDTWIYIPPNSGGFVDEVSGERYQPGDVPGFDSSVSAELAEANRLLAKGAISWTAFVQLVQIAWSQILGKPPSFTPSAHQHAASDINSGTFADARVAESNITQHQAALVLAITQITGLQGALDAKLAATLKGAANGLAELDAGGTVPLAQIPGLPAAKLDSGELDLARLPNIPWAKLSETPTTLGAYGITDARTAAQITAEIAAAVAAAEPDWSAIQNTPTTLADYGITDGMTATEIAAAIQSAVASLVDGAPDLINTLNEIAAALGDDPNFATTVTNAIAAKLDASVWLAATAVRDGFMTKEQAAKLAGIEPGATADQTAEEIRDLYEGLDDRNPYTDDEQAKLAGVEDEATADQTDEEIRDAYERNDDRNAYTDAEKAKLAAIAPNATANQSDADLLDRENHTGEQAISTVTGLQGALDARPLTSDLPFASIAQYSSTDAVTDLAAGAIVRWDSAVLTDSAISVGGANDTDITFAEAGRYRVSVRLPYEDTSAEGADVNNSLGATLTINGIGVGRQGVGSPVVNANGANEGQVFLEEIVSVETTDVMRVTTQRLSGGDALYLRSGESALIIEKVGGKSPLLAAQSIGDIAGLQDALDAKLAAAVWQAATASNLGYMTGAQAAKLDGVEPNATADQTGAEIKLAYEGEPNTNAFTDALKAKLESIDAAHYGAPVQSTTALTALAEAGLTDKERRYVEDELSDYFYNATASSGDLAPDDQTGGTGFWFKVAVDGETAASIRAKYESNPDTNAFTDAEKAKLAGVAANATANASDAALRDRSTHTGAQAISTVTGLQGALDTLAAKSDLVTLTADTTLSNANAPPGRPVEVAASATLTLEDDRPAGWWRVLFVNRGVTASFDLGNNNVLDADGNVFDFGAETPEIVGPARVVIKAPTQGNLEIWT